ncbi:MAG: glycosyltransferase [Caldithrix sp.]|nr:glycosyltransferase [Caldithrix sp.]
MFEREILYILPKPNFFTEGIRGRVSHASGVVNGLLKNGSKVHVITGPQIHKYIKDKNSNFQFVEIESKKNTIIRYVLWIFKLIASIRRYLKENQKINYLIIRYSVSNAFLIIPLIMLRNKNIKFIVEINSLIYHQKPNIPHRIRSFLIKKELFFIKQTTLLYVISNQLKEDIIRYSNIHPKNVLVIPNGGPEPMYINQDINMNKLSFLYLGVFQEYYEFKLLIEAFKKVTGYTTELHLYGYGKEKEKIVSLADKAKNIYFHGRYYLGDLISKGAININCILILPFSRRNPTGSPTKLFEYMALGLPIIASNVGQINEMLVHDKTAYIYEAGDEDSLHEGMMKMLSDRDYREHLSQNIRAIYPKNHTWTARMKQLIEAIESYE